MRLYRTSLNLCMILILKMGSFGTGGSVVQNFCPQRLIEHKQGHAGTLKDDQTYLFLAEFLETEIRCESGESKSITSLKLFVFDLSYPFS